MKTVGIITTVVAAGVLVGAIVLGVLSIPDLKRYREMRRM